MSSGNACSSCPIAVVGALGRSGAVEDGDAGAGGTSSRGIGDGAGCPGDGPCATTKVGSLALEARREEIVLMTRLEIANLLCPTAGAEALISRLRTRSETPPARLRKAPLPTSWDSGMTLIGSLDT